MQEKAVVPVVQEETTVLIAKVRPHPNLKLQTIEFAPFLGKEVILDPKKVKVFETKQGKRVQVQIALKDNPSIFSTIFTNYLVPMCDKTRQFLSLEQHI